MKRKQAYLPLLLSLILVLGMYLGMRFNYGLVPETPVDAGEKKLRQVMELIQLAYVDEVDPDSVLDLTIEELLHKLDPHSTYIPLADVQAMDEDMRGSFEGIGIEFLHLKDTLTVVHVLPGGPSERAGMKAGDRIINIADSAVAGAGLPTEALVAMLKGPSGSRVEVAVVSRERSGKKMLEIRRGPIPLPSVDRVVVDEETAYLKINRFSETTAEEVDEALKYFRSRGLKTLVLDLRDNPGGLLTAAVSVSDQFLPEGAVIVRTRDRSRGEDVKKAGRSGRWESGEMKVLIDEGTASAAEILAGALKDNGRATLVGHRTFGKGLVQQEMTLKDGSRVRLTTSRYYTPSGKSIQRPYDRGYRAYQDETLARWEGSDSLDSRPIEGGIEPDIAVRLDTVGASLWFYHFFNWTLMDEHAFRLADGMRRKWAGREQEFFRDYEVPETALAAYLQEIHAEMEISRLDVASKRKLLLRFKALVGKNLYGDSGFYPVYLQDDPFWITATGSREVVVR